MECNVCHSSMPEGSVFCSVCGARMDGKAECVSCGNELAAGSKFCNKCGASQIPATRTNRRLTKKPVRASNTYGATSPQGTFVTQDTSNFRSLLFNITGIVVCALLFIFSFLPVIKVDMTAIMKASVPSISNKDAQLKAGYSFIDIIKATTALTSEDELADYQQDLFEEIKDRVGSPSAIDEDVIREVKSVLRKFNIYKLQMASDTRQNAVASNIALFLLLFASLASVILPLIFAPFFITGLLKRKVNKSAYYGLAWMFIANILVLMMGATIEHTTMGVGAGLYLGFAMAGCIAGYVFSWLAMKNTPVVRTLIKRTISIALASLILIAFNAAMIKVMYKDGDKTFATDYESYYGMLSIADEIIDSESEPASLSEVVDRIAELKSEKRSDRKLILKSLNSLRYILFNEDMADYGNTALILAAIVPVLALAGNGLLLAFIVILLFRIYGNKEEEGSMPQILGWVSLVPQVISFALTIVLVILSNNSLEFTKLDAKTAFTAWPIIAILLTIGMMVFHSITNSQKDSAEPIGYVDPVEPKSQPPFDEDAPFLPQPE